MKLLHLKIFKWDYRRYAILIVQVHWEELVMEAPRVHSLLDIVPKVENPEKCLGHGRDDLSSATGSGNSNHPSLVINHDCGAHRAHGPLFLHLIRLGLWTLLFQGI